VYSNRLTVTHTATLTQRHSSVSQGRQSGSGVQGAALGLQRDLSTQGSRGSDPGEGVCLSFQGVFKGQDLLHDSDGHLRPHSNAIELLQSGLHDERLCVVRVDAMHVAILVVILVLIQQETANLLLHILC
jgi:hypothetical protein